MNLIEVILEMPDLELFRACAESPEGPFRDAAKRELIAERLYSEADIEDETDRILANRARREEMY